MKRVCLETLVSCDISFSGLQKVWGTGLFFSMQEFNAKQVGRQWHVVESHSPSTSSVRVK